MTPFAPKITFLLSRLAALCFVLPLPARAATRELMQYDVTWVGVSVGTMSVSSETADDGSLLRSIRVWNRPWIAKIYPVDNRVECRVEPTPNGPRHLVSKKMGEKNFAQDDVLELWPAAGRAAWSNAVSNVVHSFEVPIGTRDFVSFFYDLRDAAASGSWSGNRDYQLVMDQRLHALEIQVGQPETIRSPNGPIQAIRVRAISKSPELFARNKPRAVWVAAAKPVVVFADVETRFGAVRATLSKWEIDGQPVAW